MGTTYQTAPENLFASKKWRTINNPVTVVDGTVYVRAFTIEIARDGRAWVWLQRLLARTQPKHYVSLKRWARVRPVRFLPCSIAGLPKGRCYVVADPYTGRMFTVNTLELIDDGQIYLGVVEL
jgi:hypothetical protein